MTKHDLYIGKLNSLEKQYSTLKSLANKKIRRFYHSSRLYIAYLLLLKLIKTIKSLLKVIPDIETYSASLAEWDISTVASFTRNIIENFNIFYYLSIEEVSDEEAYFRVLLCEMHAENEKLKMFYSLDIPEELQKIQHSKVNKIRTEIKQNPFFNKTFSHDKKYDLLRGDKAVYLSNKQISSKIDIGLSKENFDFIYRFTSNYLHTSPFAIEVLSSNENNEEEILFITEMLDVIEKFLTATEQYYRKLLEEK